MHVNWEQATDHADTETLHDIAAYARTAKTADIADRWF